MIMEKTYKVLFVDDDRRYAETLIDRASGKGIELVHFDNWEEAKSELDEHFDAYEAVIVDGKGKLTKDSPGDDQIHVSKALQDLAAMKITPPFAVLSKYIELKDFHLAEFFEKGKQEMELFEYLTKAIENSEITQIKRKYSEPFNCFGDKYLERKYEKLLINIIQVFENDKVENPENLLFNPCRIMLEEIFRQISNAREKVLPHALINYEKQRVALKNCSKYLSGVSVTVDKIPYSAPKFLDDHISQQIQTIIAVCHPSSHEIQDKYSKYTFMSVLWALFDVLIWLKRFIDESPRQRKD
jgi:CheY-like chemotaxis protein